jgi:EmrB/QacA subfamily drug resistance transporter
MSNPMSVKIPSKPILNPWTIFAIILIGGFMALIDVTIVNVALPSIQHGIHTSSSTLEWIVSGYALTFGLVLILSGRIGDTVGHRWTFLTGLIIFTLASLSCSLAQNSTEIIISRLVQGIGAGTFSPAIISFIQILFEGKERSKAFGIYGAVIGLSTALGPLIGGILIQLGGAHEGWRLVFLVNVPIGVIAVSTAFKMLPHDEKAKERRHHNFDPIGIALLTAGLLLILIPLLDGQQAGWPLWTYISLIAAAPVLVSLWFWESRLANQGKEPLIATYLLKRLSFAGGSILALVYFAAFTSIFFILSILWQEGFNHNPLATGLMIVPFAIGSMVAASQSDKVSARLGRWVLVIGCLLVAIGLALLEVTLRHGGINLSAWKLTAPLLIAGIGNGLFIAPNQDFILKSVDRQNVGSASGILATSQRLGSSIGIAAIGTVFFSSIHIKHQPHAVAHAFLSGAQVALVVNLGLALLALVLVFILPKKTSSAVAQRD